MITPGFRLRFGLGLILTSLFTAPCLLPAAPPQVADARSQTKNPDTTTAAAKHRNPRSHKPILFTWGGVVTTHPDGSLTEFAAANSSDSARGHALLQAVAAVQDGDHLDLSQGVFDIATNFICLSPPAGGAFHLHGAGKTETTIKRTSGNNAIIIPVSHSQTTDLTLLADDPRSTMCGWGLFGAISNIEDAWLQNVSISSWTDGIWFRGNVTLTANIINVSVFTRWDGVYICDVSRPTVVNFYNCDCVVTADTNVIDSVGQARCYLITGGTMNLYGCTGVATDCPRPRGGDSPDSMEFAYAVQSGVGRYNPGQAYLYGGSFQAKRPGEETPRPGREIDLFGGSSSARIFVSPTVVYSTFADALIPAPYPPGKITDIQWTVPELPPRSFPRPEIINKSISRK